MIKKEIPVTKEFENVLKEIQEGKPEFKCMRGPVIMTSNTKSILKVLLKRL